MVEVFGISFSQNLVRLLLVLSGSGLTLLGREIIPYEWERYRENKRKESEATREWYEDSIQYTTEVYTTIQRQTSTADIDYSALQMKFDSLSDRMAKKADKVPEGVDSQTPIEIGEFSLLCMQLASIFEIYNEYDGTDRILQSLLVWDLKSEDVSIGEVVELFHSLPEELVQGAQIEERHVDSEKLETALTEMQVDKNETTSLFQPAIIELIHSVDSNQLNHITNMTLRNMLNQIMLETAVEIRQNIEERR